MTKMPTKSEFKAIGRGYHENPARSLSLRAEAYTDAKWYAADQEAIIARTWQWVCHVEKVREPGSYATIDIAGRPIAIVRDRDGALRAFYNVCKHRAHHLLSGHGQTTRIMCPYHAWVYRLDGQLIRAPHTEPLESFDTQDICLDQVQVEAFCGFIYVNLDPTARSLAELSGDLDLEIKHWAPDIDQLTFGHRLTYDIQSNWKNVVDNFLECYHCPTAHKDFCTLVDMDTYKVTTHGIYSSHMAEAGVCERTAPIRRLEGATVKHPCRLVALAQYLHHALSGPLEQYDRHEHVIPAGPEPYA